MDTKLNLFAFNFGPDTIKIVSHFQLKLEMATKNEVSIYFSFLVGPCDLNRKDGTRKKKKSTFNWDFYVFLVPHSHSNENGPFL